MDSASIIVQDLSVTFLSRNASDPPAMAVRGVSLQVRAGSVHALVGESGSGKSVTGRAMLGIVGFGAHVHVEGSVRYKDKDLLSLPEDKLRAIRGSEIAMIFQEPSRYLNPSLMIGVQIGEVVEAHFGARRRDAMKRAKRMLEVVELPERVARRYPHELSGGMKQRAMIAMALVCGPTFVIADEPTTSLDMTVQQQILELLGRLQVESNLGMLFISHDLAVVQEMADHISVMYAGKIVESAPSNVLFSHPLHPYTRLLLQAVPHADRRGTPLSSIGGRAPDARNIPQGCAFHPRCPIAVEACRHLAPIEETYEAQHAAACHMVHHMAANQTAEGDR